MRTRNVLEKTARSKALLVVKTALASAKQAAPAESTVPLKFTYVET